MKTKSALLLIACAFVLGACGKKDKGSSAAGLPGGIYNQFNNACVQGAPTNYFYGMQQFNIRPYQPRHYTYYSYSWDSRYGVTIYNSQAQGFCGCPSGYMPACDAQLGMACVRTRQFRNSNPIHLTYDDQFKTVASEKHRRNRFNSRLNCHSGFTQMCRVGQPNSCANTGGTCQPTSYRSSFGVCVL